MSSYTGRRYRRYGSSNYRNRSSSYYGRPYYNNRSYGSTSVGRAIGNMRAAKQQADQSTFTINVPGTISAFLQQQMIIPNQPSETGIYAMNIYDVLRKSTFFDNYASMYDEFKIERVKVKLLPTTFTYTVTAGGEGATKSSFNNCTVYTAWDRTGLNKDQVVLNLTGVTNNDTSIGVISGEGEADNVAGLYCTVGSDITTYSSAESRVVNPGTNTSITRWLNPKTIQEKSQWLSTTLLKEWYTGYDETKGRYIGIPTGKNTGPGESNPPRLGDGETEIGETITIPNTGTGGEVGLTVERLSAMNKDNPCYLVEDSGIRFKPTLLVGVYPAVQSGESNRCAFNVETEVVCSFRGLRKAKVVTA